VTSTNCQANCSRGIHLELDAGRKSARVVAEYFHPASLQSAAMGGLQNLPNGNVLTGRGTNPTFVEYQGSMVVMDVRLGIMGINIPP
jgi:hypothetical protein